MKAMARTETMHRITVGVAIVVTAALTGFGGTVTNVRGVQRENSEVVDIYYGITASDGGTYKVEIEIEERTL